MYIPSPHNEKELLLRVAARDQRAFTLLVEQYAATVYRHVLQYIKSAPLAEEITQDIFLKIWENVDALANLQSFAAYLHVITRNRTISELRKKLDGPVEAAIDEIEEKLLTPATQLEYRQLSDILQQGIELLPSRRKQVFKMSRFEGMTYEHIATELSISKGTVNEHIVEALAFLRGYLKGQMGNAITASVLIHTLFSK